MEMQPLQANGSLRLFYALWPDDATRAALARLQTAFTGRKTKYENLHLTLAFLGQQPADLLPPLEAMLAALPGKSMPLIIDRAGYFKKNRIAWAGVHAVPDALHYLRRTLVQLLDRHGIAFDAHTSFKPHITLARDALPPQENPFEPIRWQARQVALVQSSPGTEGLTYRVLAIKLLKDD